MEIRIFTTGNISEFVNSTRFSRLKHIPISPHRALSYSNNPRSEPGDEILFVAFENDEVIGYLGALPEKIFINGVWKRMTWLSCFWVDPAFRSKGTSKQLFDVAMHSWNNTALITNMKPGTLKIYERTGYFHPPMSKTGIRGYLRFNFAEILPARGRAFNRLRPVFKALDFVLNIGNAVRLAFYPGYKPEHGNKTRFVKEISDQAGDLIEECNLHYLNRRGKTEIEWITRFPWVLEGSENEESRRYYFSSVSKRFFWQKVEFSSETGDVKAFLMISVRDNHLTLPYAFFREGMESAIIRFLYNIMLDYQLNMMTVFHPGLAERINHGRSPFLFRKKILRPYFLPKTLDIRELAFQDGDGDCVFT